MAPHHFAHVAAFYAHLHAQAAKGGRDGYELVKAAWRYAELAGHD